MNGDDRRRWDELIPEFEALKTDVKWIMAISERTSQDLKITLHEIQEDVKKNLETSEKYHVTAEKNKTSIKNLWTVVGFIIAGIVAAWTKLGNLW